MKNQIVASIAAIPFALGTVFAGTGAANAAALSGMFSFDGAGAKVTLTDEGLDFTDGASINLNLKTGSFTDFTEAYIYDVLDPFSSTKFIDLGAADDSNVFYATGFDVTYDSGSVFTGIDVEIQGYFESEGGETSKGSALITLQALTSDVEAGGDIEATFSGISVAAVPEPATLFGLGVVATGLVATRRKKNS